RCGVAVSLAMMVRSRFFCRTISSIARSGVPTAMNPPIMMLAPSGIMATDCWTETASMVFALAAHRALALACVCPGQDRERMSLDHGLFVGRNDIKGHAARRPRNQRCAGGVGGGIDLDPEPAQLCGDACAHARRVLANSGREHEGIDPAER